MNVNGVTNQLLSEIPSTGPPEASQELDEEDFLTLLLTQLQYQDPLDPMESVDMMDQIAALNQVEQLQVANNSLDALILGMASLNNASAMQLMDREVMVVGDTFTADDGSVPFGYVLGQDVDEVEISILDSQGNAVQTLEYGATTAGLTQLSFDEAQAGETYTVVVHAYSDGVEVDAQAAVVGRVDGLDFSAGLVQLVVGDQLIGLDEVLVVLPIADITPTEDGTETLAQQLTEAVQALGTQLNGGNP